MFDDLVGIPGLEPGKAGPESAVLPLHHIPLFNREVNGFVSQLRCKGNNIFWNLQIFSHFFLKKNHFSSFHLIYLIKKHKNMGNKGDNSRI